MQQGGAFNAYGRRDLPGRAGVALAKRTSNIGEVAGSQPAAYVAGSATLAAICCTQPRGLATMYPMLSVAVFDYATAWGGVSPQQYELMDECCMRLPALAFTRYRERMTSGC